MVSMNKLSTPKRVQVIRCLVEGNSIRSTVRITGVAKNTVSKLLVDLGRACSRYQYETLQHLTCKRIQVDEIWSFCYSKAKNVPAEHDGEFGYGDVWTFTGICQDCKLVASWLVGERNEFDAAAFIKDLADRLDNRVQLTSDGARFYLQPVEDVYHGEIDYAMLIKHYGNEGTMPIEAHRRYSPAVCTSTETRRIAGRPDEDYITTSHVERQNLTRRMGMRRFTRLTNAFSKKAENLAHAVALHFMYYNFVRKHQTIKTTPAVEAGIADHEWTIEEIARLLENQEYFVT
jgi:hypothetical protein